MNIKKLKKRAKKAKIKLVKKGNRASSAYQYLVNQAKALETRGHTLEAIRVYKMALAVNEKASYICFQLGFLYGNMNYPEEAEKYQRKGLEIQPHYSLMLCNLGIFLQRQGKFLEAEKYFRKAIALEPDSALYYYWMGTLFEARGLVKEAISYYRQTLDLDRGYGRAFERLAFLDKFREGDKTLAQLEKVYNDGNIQDDQKEYMALGLGKVYQQHGLYDKAFTFIRKANDLKRETYVYDIQRDKLLFNKIEKQFNSLYFAKMAGAGFPVKGPIFIVGMMRSGTSLVEQILASHPDVEGMGELEHIQNIVEIENGNIYSGEFFNNITAKSPEDFAEMGRTYYKKICKHLKVDFPGYFTDKMPANFRFVGLIKLLFPNAKVIHCLRNPMDTCLSIYSNFFSGIHPFAHNLKELGEYYRSYNRLMAHWDKTLPGFVYEIVYEDILADQEKQTRSLLEFCDLKWDEGCLEFHKTKRTVATISSSQVRRPIYKDSLRLWEKYGANLDPLKEALKYVV